MTKYFLRSSIKRLLSGTVIVTVGLLINGAFAYLLQLFLGRHLSIEDYGTFSALLSLFYLFSVPSAVIGISVVKIASELLGEDKHSELSVFFWDLCKKVLLWGLAVVLIVFLFRNPLAHYLNINNPILFFFLGLYTLGTFLVLPPQAYLRGLLMFKKFAAYTTVVGFLRLAIPVTLVYLGYSVGGVYVGLFLSLVVSFFFALLLFKGGLRKEKDVDIKHLYKKVFNFSVPVLLIHLGLMVLINMDVILVKKYFTGDLAGYYSGVVTLGKLILFGAGAVAMVMFPEISSLKSAGKEFMTRFKFFVAFQLALVLPAVAIFTIFPDFITLLFFGEQFSSSIQYLPLFSVFISLYVLAHFLIQFFLAIGKTSVYVFLLVPIVFQFVLINMFHSNVYQVIRINIISTLILLVSLCVYLYKVTREIAPD